MAKGAQLAAPSLAERAGWLLVEGDTVEVPRGASTDYLTHGLFRYVGKLPPPLVGYLLHEFGSPGDIVLDPMCGGGTTAIEAVTGEREARNFDINPVSLLVTEALTHGIEPAQVETFVDAVLWKSDVITPPPELSGYFSPEAYGLIRSGLDRAMSPVERTLVLSIARRASFANTKKINTVVDKTKQPSDASKLLRQAASAFTRAFRAFNESLPLRSQVEHARADRLPLPDDSVDFVLLHPPYLSNTAFSEATEIQLLLLGQQPRNIRDQELAYRGSYFHVPNGLKKYLIGWNRILAEAARVVRPGGTLAVVVGDGRVDQVRIPVGTLTQEFCQDLGLPLLWRAIHRLNNQTGWTLSRRMTEQHVLVFKSS